MSATFLNSYELSGKKESVANFISNISPTETPFSSMTRKGSVSNTLFQWLTDTDDDPAIATEVREGAEASDSKMTEPKILNSHTQIFQRTAKVSGTAQAMGLYGRGKPMAYQMMKAGRAIKREIEMTLLAKQNGQSATSGRGGKLDGVLTRRADAGTPKVPATNIIQSATQKTFLETELQDLLAHLWIIGAKPSVIMFPPKYAAQLASLREHSADANMNMFDGEVSVTVNRKVDTYVDPLGQRLKLIPNRYMPEDIIYVFDPSMFEQKILRNFHTKDLAISGDYERKQLIVELGLANKNPEAMGVYNLTSSKIEGEQQGPAFVVGKAPSPEAP